MTHQPNTPEANKSVQVLRRRLPGLEGKATSLSLISSVPP